MHKGRPNLTLAGSITNLEILIWNFIIIRGMGNVLVFFNSTLTPFLCCYFKSILITKLEYSRGIRDHHRPCTQSWPYEKTCSHFMTIESKASLEFLALLQIKRFVRQLTAARIISVLKFHLMVKNWFVSLKFWKKMNKYNGRNKNWFKNYYALTSFMWFPLAFPFHSRDCHEYHGMNKRLYANFWCVNNMNRLTLP